MAVVCIVVYADARLRAFSGVISTYAMVTIIVVCTVLFPYYEHKRYVPVLARRQSHNKHELAAEPEPPRQGEGPHLRERSA